MILWKDNKTSQYEMSNCKLKHEMSDKNNSQNVRKISDSRNVFHEIVTLQTKCLWRNSISSDEMSLTE